MVLGMVVVTGMVISGGSLAYSSLEQTKIVEAATTSSNEEPTIISENEPISDETYSDNVAPVLSSSDVTINQGDSIDVLDGVTATDNVDGDLTSQIQSSGTVDTSIPGTYTVDLSVTDTAGNISSATKTITVNVPSTGASNEVSTQSDTGTDDSTTSVTTDYNEDASKSDTSATSTETVVNQNSSTSYAAMTMYLNGIAISYQNGGEGSGQSIIDSNSSIISTWGGAATQSGSDGLNTHFIGHNTGAFSSLSSLGSGSQIVVTDANGTPTTYTVSSVFQVDDSGYGISDGMDYWDTITGTGGGERITLQTCITDSTNLIVVAYA